MAGWFWAKLAAWRWRIDWFILLPAALGVAAAGLILLREATYGVGLTVDSSAYISVARNLLEGNGFLQRNGGTYQDAAPFYPMTLAFDGIFGPDAIVAAGYVNAAAFGLTVFVATLWLRWRGVSPFLVVWAGGACALSLTLAQLAASAWTEPLFILFSVLSLFALDRFLDSDKRSYLIWAAVCAALFCLTRYMGVALTCGPLLLLLLQKGARLPAKARNAAVYAVIALTPIGAWMLRNFLLSGSPTGQSYPTGFSWLGSLHSASSEFIRLGFGNISFNPQLGICQNIRRHHRRRPYVCRCGHYDRDFAGSSSRRRIRADIAAPPGAFTGLGSVGRSGGFPVGLCAFPGNPLSDYYIAIYWRFTAPMYMPALVATTLVLNEFLTYAVARRPSVTLPFLRRRSSSTGAMATISLPALVLMAGLFLWLLPQVYTNYHNIKHWLDNGGYGYSSRQWAESETVRYLISRPLDGRLWTTAGRALYLLPDVPGDYRQLPPNLPDNWPQWVADAHADGKDAYFVWFHDNLYSWFYFVNPQYSFGDIGALPGMEIVAILADGIILKSSKDSPSNSGVSVTDALLQDAQPVIQSDFDVYLDDNANRLIYVRYEPLVLVSVRG